ncbi:Gp5 baseplate hub subunit and tail lysozyme [Devosia sp. DBB001]|nr:Gp5 baseplate hub subunit and tail lysozyme [Devosia sp. DBB001]
MTDPIWLTAMRKYIGVAEIKGAHHNPTIIERIDWADGKKDGKQLQGIKDDELPWCASFLSGVLEENGIVSARSAWARSYLNWGQKLGGPAVGAIVVFERGPQSGHVAIVAGRDARGNIVCIGANQSDMVKASPFATGRVLGYRWPPGYALPKKIGMDTLPLVNSDGKVSGNEA